MVASAARIEANRKNATLSTGPRTPEGKDRSRANALTHGLRSSVVAHPDDAGVVGDQVLEVAPSADILSGLKGWFEGQVTLAASKIERCQTMELAAMERIAARASIVWDDDRRLDAVRLGAKLARRPEEIVAELRETLQGCEWLTSRWVMLAQAAKAQGGLWTPDQARLASNLLGTPVEFREGLPLEAQARPGSPPPDPVAIAYDAVEELSTLLEALSPLDEAARLRAEAGLSDDAPEIRRLRRYEAELHRRMKWSLKMVEATTLEVRDQGEEQDQVTEPSPDEPVESEAGPTPFRATSFGQSDPAPSRAARRLQKAESRREAKRRKAELMRH